MKKNVFLSAIVAVVSLLVPACSQAPSVQLHPIKGEFVEAQAGEIAQTLNWIVATDRGASKRCAAFMVEPLAVFNNQYKPQLRCLAKDVEVSKDGLSYTVTIRDDLKWSDGSRVTSEDYVFTIKNLLLADWLQPPDMELWQEAAGGEVTGVQAEAVGETVFKIKRKTADPNFIYAVYDLMPYPKSIARNYEYKAEEFISAPEFNNMSYCGNLGPYRPTSWTTSGGLVMARNPGYYLSRDNGAPYFEKYTIKQMGIQQLIDEGLKDGSVTYAYIEPQFANEFRNQKNINVVTVPTGQFLMVAYNQRANGWAGLKDPRVRQALSMVIDKPAIINDVFGGYADPAYSIIPQYSPWYSDSAVSKYGMSPSADAQKAVDLIKSAGYEMKDVDGKKVFVDADGKPIKLILPVAIDSEVQKSVAYIIGQSLRGIGIDVDARYQVQDFITKEIFVNKQRDSKDNPDYNSGPGAVSSQSWDMVMISSYGDALTPNRSEIFFSSKGRLNIFGFYDDKIDALYSRASSAEAVDPVSRQKIYDELAGAISGAQPTDLICFYKDNFAFNSKVKGVEPGYNMLYNYQFWYPE